MNAGEGGSGVAADPSAHLRHLLVINPNTSACVSTLLQQHVQAVVGGGVAVRTMTARFGAPYIACEASYAVAAHAALDAWAIDCQSTQPLADAVLLGCFGDPGLWALRESSPVPVTGLAEASFTLAARHGRFGVVTGGERWAPMLQRLAQALGFAEALAGIHTVVPTGAQLAADPDGAADLLAQACEQVAQRGDVDAIVLGGAGLAGMAARVQPRVSVPVLDSVQAGAQWALQGAPANALRARQGGDVRWQGVSAALQAMGLPA